MLDDVLIANEIVDEVKRKKNECLMLKVKFEKAYDSINWNFLMYMMRRMRICEKWIGWIKEGLVSSSMSILVNRSPT